MPRRSEQLFNELQDAAAILALIGQSEDAHLDCKEWPNKDEDAQKVFAKAACGLTNADGGVLVIGMRAKPVSKEQPDLIESAREVRDTATVKSRILDLIGQLVEPPVEGIEAHEVKHPENSTRSGFVVVYIPASHGLPRRCRKTWKFYLRIGSGTFPMEYFQIAEMFGRRPQPNLKPILQHNNFGPVLGDQSVHQFFFLGLFNDGRGLAKFPSIRFQRSHGLHVSLYGLDGNGGHALPLRPSESEWIVFRGGVDDVIYPGATLKITQVYRNYTRIDQIFDRVIFDELRFSVEISCEGTQSRVDEIVIPRETHG
jgi:Putative DNA-binding domain